MQNSNASFEEGSDLRDFENALRRAFGIGFCPPPGLDVTAGAFDARGRSVAVGFDAPGPARLKRPRGFVGIAFRRFYLRPTNERADDQVRRNHATQYISHRDWPLARLRKETPSQY
jgi:hypothetical protein